MTTPPYVPTFHTLSDADRARLWRQAHELNRIAGYDDAEGPLSDLMMEVANGLMRALAMIEGTAVEPRPRTPRTPPTCSDCTDADMKRLTKALVDAP